MADGGRDYKADAEFYERQLKESLEAWKKDNEWRDKRIAEHEQEIKRLRKILYRLADTF